MPSPYDTREAPDSPVAGELNLGTPEPIRVLHVSPTFEDFHAMRRLSFRMGWTLLHARTVAEAVRRLRAALMPVVICERELPDGDWLLLRNAALQFPSPPRLVVCSRTADERLWSVVLNLGGFDVLSLPFEPREVHHVVTHAWTSWHQEARRAARQDCGRRDRSALGPLSLSLE